MIGYKLILKTKTNEIHKIDGWIRHGNKLTKKLAEQLAREELADPQYMSATVLTENGTKVYSR
jgi:hypothetical protein